MNVACHRIKEIKTKKGQKVLEYLPWCIEHDESGVHGLQGAVKVGVSEVDGSIGEAGRKCAGQE